MKYLNVGCGNCFIQGEDWLNLDANPVNEYVQNRCLDDLAQNGLTNSFDCIYASHLIEHLSHGEAVEFLSLACSLLRVGGTLRLVTPDFDSIIEAYLSAVNRSQFGKAKFEKVLLLEQCVRTVASGTYRMDVRQLLEEDPAMANYIDLRTGEHPLLGKADGAISGSKSHDLSAVTKRAAIRFKKRFRRFILTALKLALPSSIASNILSTDFGERHLWVYSFFELQSLGLDMGFVDAHKVESSQSRVLDSDALERLDGGYHGSTRKGTHSMFIEMRKA